MKINFLNTASDKPNTCINLNLCVYKSNLYHCIVGPYTNLKSRNSGGSGGMATPAPLIRTPRPYSKLNVTGDDFALWIRRFEAYTRAVRIPDDKLSDALLALLDDAAFRAFDLLGLPEETVKDYTVGGRTQEEVRSRRGTTGVTISAGPACTGSRGDTGWICRCTHSSRQSRIPRNGV